MSVGKQGDASSTVATVLNFSRVGVENSVTEVDSKRIGRLQYQQLVKSDTGVAITPALDQRLGDMNFLTPRIEHHKVVAKTVHFGKPNAHR